jgi:hypothetical protein
VAARRDQQSRVSLVLIPLKAGKPVEMDIGNLELAVAWGGTTNVSWFPDSRRILYAATEPGHRVRSYTQDTSGGQPHPVTPEGTSGTVLTHDGSTLLVRDSESKAWLYSLEGGAPKPLPFLNPADIVLTFSADGRFLYVTKGGEVPRQIRRVTLADGRFELWRETPAVDSAGLRGLNSVQITPDGESIAYAGFRTVSELYMAEGLK